MRVFDSKRTAYKSGKMKFEDFEILKKLVMNLLDFTPEQSRGCITSKEKKQRNKSTILSEKTDNVK